jgi:hypothetical protein
MLVEGGCSSDGTNSTAVTVHAAVVASSNSSAVTFTLLGLAADDSSSGNSTGNGTSLVLLTPGVQQSGHVFHNEFKYYEVSSTAAPIISTLPTTVIGGKSAYQSSNHAQQH